MRLSQCGVVCGFVTLFLLVVVPGCGSGRVVLPITIDPGLTPPQSVFGMPTNETAVRGIAAILVKDLGLPVPQQVTVYIYASREVFEQGLIQDANVSPSRAAELSDFAIGVGKRRQLLLNDEAYQQRGASGSASSRTS